MQSYGASMQLSVISMAVILTARLTQAQLEPSWIQPPEDTSSPEGSIVTLSCRIENRAGRPIAWIRYKDGSSENLFTNNDPWTEDNRLSVHEFSNGFDFTISGLNRDDNAEYQCELARSTLKKKVTITVLGKFVTGVCWTYSFH